LLSDALHGRRSCSPLPRHRSPARHSGKLRRPLLSSASLAFIAVLAQNETYNARYIAMQSLVGIWKLVEAHASDEAGHEVPSPLGPEPMGVLLIEAERIMVTAGDGRVTLPPEAPKRAFVAYSGPYTFDGTKYVCHVDSASSPEMFVDQIRRVRFESPTRMVVHPLSRLLDRGAGLEFVFERVG
jgi:hypothetical protein